MKKKDYSAELTTWDKEGSEEPQSQFLTNSKEYATRGEVDQKMLKIGEYLERFDSNKRDFKEELRRIKEEYDRKIENSKLTIIETLGIFVALFTFVSIEFQVFRMYRDPQAISGLTLVLLGSTTFLMSIFDISIINARSIKNRNTESKKRAVFKQENLKRNFFRWCNNNWARSMLVIIEIGTIIYGTRLFIGSDIEDLEDAKNDLVKEVRMELKENFKNDVNVIVNEKLNNFEDIKNAQNDIRILQEKDTCMKYKDYWEYDQCFK
jgi:hypothetical protein